MERDFKEDVKIDPNNLEKEWLEQPSLYVYYAEAHADALHQRDLAKSRMDYTYSKLYSKVKKDWDKHFDSKPTESALKEYILKNATFKKAEKVLINAARDANILAGAKTAMDHRKRALENLVSLRISGFHSDPSTSRVKTGMRQVEKKKFTKRQRRQSS